MREIARSNVGDTITIDRWREGKTETISVPVAGDPADMMTAGPKMEAPPSWAIP